MCFGGEWRPVFFVLAIPGLIGVFILWKYMADTPGEMLKEGKMSRDEYDLITSSVGEESELSAKTFSTQIFLKDFQYYLFTINFFILLMIYWGMTTWISTFLVKQHGMDIKTMGLFVAVPYLVAGFAMWLGGYCADKFFQGRMKVVSMIGFLGCIPVLYLLGNVPKGDTRSAVALSCSWRLFC